LLNHFGGKVDVELGAKTDKDMVHTCLRRSYRYFIHLTFCDGIAHVHLDTWMDACFLHARFAYKLSHTVRRQSRWCAAFDQRTSIYSQN